MTAEDIPAGLSLCRSAGWNQTAADWELFLKLSPRGCRVAVDEEGKVRGTVATLRYEGRFSWIGMVLVEASRHRQGIGIQLLRESLHVLKDEETVKLDATPAGRKIYLQLEFVDEYSLIRMQLKEIASGDLPVSTARPVAHRDLTAIAEFDRDVFGADRKPVLNSILKRAPQYAFLREDQNGIKGYCFGRTGHEFAHIGPVVSKDVQSAAQVVSAALRSCKGSPVVIDALQHSPKWVQWLSSLGFEEQRPLMRMYRGANAYPGKPEKQFAILGPEFG